MTTAEAAREFLAQDRIAIVGLSRNASDFSRAIATKLRNAGREVVPVNPSATEIDGARCYPNLSSIEPPVGAVLIATPSASAASLVQECADLGIRHVWLHRSLGQGSASNEAVELARRCGITLIPAGCPMMFCEPVDIAHRCARWCLSVAGRIPKTLPV